MTAEQLKKFIKDNNTIYYRFNGEILMMVKFKDLSKFSLMLSEDYTYSKAIIMYFCPEVLSFCMDKICEDFGINTEEIFPYKITKHDSITIT